MPIRHQAKRSLGKCGFKNVSDDGLFAAYAEIIQQIGDEKLKLYLYHFPATSGIPITIPLIERLLVAYPNTVMGIKDSTGDLENMRTMATQFPGFRVFAGTDKLLLEVLKVGGAGTISATANVMPAQASRVFAAWKSGNSSAAEKHQKRLTMSCAAFDDYINDVSRLVPALRAVTERHTGSERWRAMRPPLAPLSLAERNALFGVLDRIGLDVAEAA